MIDWIEKYPFLITGAYTQVSNWQQFIDSAPFRDTNYKPEVFLTLPIEYNISDDFKFNNIYLGFKHSSNGLSQKLKADGTINRELSMSRSWNRLYLSTEFSYKNLFMKATYWHRIEEPELTNDNPDIMDYYGCGELEFNYIYKESLTTLYLRKNFKDIDDLGSIKASFTYPLVKEKNLFFYTEVFHGYGQSLIDYDKKLTQFGIGFSISR